MMGGSEPFDRFPETEKQRQNRRTFAAAARFAGIFAVAALVVLLACLGWLSSCKSGTGQGSLDHCSWLQRNALAIGPALILLVGGVWAFVRTYQTWRAQGSWVVWQGAGWFLMMLMLVVLFMTAPFALLT
jgi:hypothetical protein